MDFIQLLQNLYIEHKRLRPQLSLRNFCRRCGVSVGQYSDYINKRRNISSKTALRIIDNLKLTESQRTEMIASLDDKKRKKSRNLNEIETEVISNPDYTTLVTLMKSDDFNGEISWLQKKLKMKPAPLNEMLEKLQTMKIIEFKDHQKIKCISEDLITTTEIPSVALKMAHKATLLRVVNEIDRVPLADRQVMSITLCLDPKKIPELKKRIEKFLIKSATYSESGKKLALYDLNVQLFPYDL